MIIYFALIIGLIGLMICALVLSSIARIECRDYCKTLNSTIFDTIENGQFNSKDLCICYLEDGVKTKIMGEK